MAKGATCSWIVLYQNVVLVIRTKSEQKHTTKNFDEFHKHSSLLIMTRPLLSFFLPIMNRSLQLFHKTRLVMGEVKSIKVRKCVSHIGLLSKVIPLKLFLDTVPFFRGYSCPLRGCFGGGFVYVVSFQSKGKPPTLLGCRL